MCLYSIDKYTCPGRHTRWRLDTMCEFVAARTMEEGKHVTVSYGTDPPYTCPEWNILPWVATSATGCDECAGEDETQYRVLRGWASAGLSNLIQRPFPTFSAPSPTQYFDNPPQFFGDPSQFFDETDNDSTMSDTFAEEEEVREEGYDAGYDAGYEAAHLSAFDEDLGRGHDVGWLAGMRARDHAVIDVHPRPATLSPADPRVLALPVEAGRDPSSFRTGYVAGHNAGQRAAAELAFHEGYQMGQADRREEVFFGPRFSPTEESSSVDAGLHPDFRSYDSDEGDDDARSSDSSFSNASWARSFSAGHDAGLASMVRGATDDDFRQGERTGFYAGQDAAMADRDTARVEDFADGVNLWYPRRRAGFAFGFNAGLVAALDEDFFDGYYAGRDDEGNRRRALGEVFVDEDDEIDDEERERYYL